jgi:hypothetical protein
MAKEPPELRGLAQGGSGGRARITGVPRRSWLRKSRAERPCCQHVRHTDIRTTCARASAQVRLPPQTFRRMTPQRMASSALDFLSQLLRGAPVALAQPP